ncbi:transcriptional regulator, GntR family [Albimonas donghaensis]|uniref:Transcriptional regulator, GntR family n=1 Tax=Albimonas donghaensis TaxID=356660 RepID=A0A1H2VPA7_9RHOB|nr:PLP-dependent aminotransferase family protein [Albimonas donghaensis]SDW70131.1 transcriptional regulator, GntR family [Albimonas donghaensis]
MAERIQTNSPDWSALIPVLPAGGPRQAALRAEIRRLIEQGAVSPGAKLPTTRDLAARLGLSRGAAVAAYETLQADGYLEARTGAGTYVAARVPRLPSAAPAPDAASDAGAVSDAGGASDAADAAALRDVSPALPGAVGVATPDPRTMGTFRALLSRHLARAAPAHFAYGDPRGGRALREAASDYLRAARGLRCAPERIVITSGSQQALDLVARGVLAPGDRAWIEDPCYPMARAALEGAGLRLTGVPVDADGLDPAAGEAMAPDARAAYVTPSHQFPLGVTMTMPRRLALIDWARRAGAWILEDDYDSEFRYAGPPLTALQGMDGAGRTIYIGTFSKALFPGLRVGYLALPEPLLDPVLRLRARTDRHPATLAEDALAAFLREGHFAAHLRRARRRARAARDALVDALREGGVAAAPPDQGLHLIVPLPPQITEAEAIALARAAGFGARALAGLHLSAPPPGRHGVVVGFSGFPPDMLAEAARGWTTALRDAAAQRGAGTVAPLALPRPEADARVGRNEGTSA